MPEHQSRSCFAPDSFGLPRGSTNAAKGPKSLLHVHTVESCDFNASPKQSAWSPWDPTTLSLPSKIWCLSTPAQCLRMESKKLGSKEQVDRTSFHLGTANAVPKRLHLPLLGFQRSPLRRDLAYRPVPNHTTNAMWLFGCRMPLPQHLPSLLFEPTSTVFSGMRL